MPPIAPPPRPGGAIPPIRPLKPQQQKPQQPQGATGQFNQLHPRGRGGKWITKPGDGYGSTGANPTTAQLQQRLNQLGYKVPVDGQYGPATAAAVHAFQKKYGLSDKFGVDAATQEFLQNPPEQSIAQIQKAKGVSTKGKGRGSTKITPAQKQQQKTVAADTKAAIAQGKIASAETRQAGHDTNVADAKHDAAQAQTAANRAEKLAKEAKAAAVGGTAQAKRSAISAEHTAQQAEKNAKSAAKAVKALKVQIAKQKAARIKRAQGPLPGEYAVLANTVHIHHGGGSATMKLTPPTKGKAAPHRTGKVQVATSAEQPTEQPNLEENEMPKPVEEGTWTGGNGVDNTTTIAFGYGGDPSMSIKDGRDPTPEADKPVWTRTGVDTSKTDTTIQDGRTAAPPPPTDTMIQDGRSTTDVLKLLLTEAVEARKAAKTGDEFTRAFARERALRAKLAVAEGLWDPGKHPRGRGGKWMEVMNKLLGKGGAPARLHVRHLEDMGDDYLNARLHPDSDATESERKAIRAVQARRAAKLGQLTAGLRTGATFEGSIRAPRTMTKEERRGGVPANERPLSQVQRPLSQVQKPLSKIQKPLH